MSSREERSAVYLYGCLPKLFKDGATDQIGKNRWKFFCLYISTNVRKKLGTVSFIFSRILQSFFLKEYKTENFLIHANGPDPTPKIVFL